MAIALAQTPNIAAGSGTTVAVAYGSNNTAGNLLVCCVGTADNGTQISGVADSLGQTWLNADKITKTGTEASIWYFPNSLGGANTVTASFGASMFASQIVVLEYSGCATASPLDQHNTGTGFGTVPLTSNITTLQNDEVLVGCACTSTAAATATPGTNWTEEADTAGNRPLHVQDRIVSATGTYNSTETFTGANGDWAAIIASFKGGAAAAGMTSNVRIS